MRKITVECKAINIRRSANGSKLKDCSKWSFGSTDIRIGISKFQFTKILIHDIKYLNCNVHDTKIHLSNLLRDLKKKMFNLGTTPSLIPRRNENAMNAMEFFDELWILEDWENLEKWKRKETLCENFIDR